MQFAWKAGGAAPSDFANLISTHVIARGKVRGGPSLKVEGARCPWTPPDRAADVRPHPHLLRCHSCWPSPSSTNSVMVGGMCAPIGQPPAARAWGAWERAEELRAAKGSVFPAKREAKRTSPVRAWVPSTPYP
jgi:hypothetical protein|eukprot:COSAG03_NODE_714_length_6148_cov_12.953050_2_plen_133_part_00